MTKHLLPVVHSMAMKATFLRTYPLFTILTLLVVIPLELVFSPVHSKTVAEYGLGYFIQHSLGGMIVLYAFLGLIGTVLFLKKGYTPLNMGILSLILGFFIEFVFMKPDWVSDILTLKVGGGTLIAVLLSAVYWIAVWGVPSYVIQHVQRDSEGS
jgi:hypothetical protein